MHNNTEMIMLHILEKIHVQNQAYIPASQRGQFYSFLLTLDEP